MEQNRPEEKTIIEKSLSRGQEVSFSAEEAPAKIELSLGGARDKHPEGTGAKPATLSIYKVSELPKVNDQYVYDGYIIDPTCAYIVASDEYHDLSDPANITGIKGIRSDDQIVIGRGHDRFPNLYSNTSVSRQHLHISTDENGTLTIKDTSTYGTVVSYERPEHQGDSGGWGSLRHYAPPSSQERSLTPERNELDDFSERIQFLAQPLGTDIDGNRFNEPPMQAQKRESKNLRELWDVILSPTATDEQREQAHQTYARRQLSEGIKGRDKVSIKGFYSSMNWLKGLAGTNIKGIIDEHAPYDVETGFDGFKKTINEIRRNHQLRCQLLEFFGKKLEAIRELSPYSLPERVYYDDPGNLKHPNHPGYSDKMTSSEYAAVLALSMIDGSFDPDSEDDMESDTRKDGTPICGQHREAAWKILFDVKADLRLQDNLYQEGCLL